jgi:hypothetical protein
VVSLFAVDSFDGASGPSAATQIAPGVWSVQHGEGFTPPPGAVRLAAYDPAVPLIEQIAGAAREAIHARYDAAIEARTGPTGARLTALMNGVEIAFRAAAYGGLEADEAAQAQALLELAGRVREALATREAALAAVDAALAAGDRDALVAMAGGV